MPVISIVIATYNRSDYLKNCLRSLERQDFPKNSFEVIVINDGSTDSTLTFLDHFSRNTILSVRVISHQNMGVSASRNKGIHSANSPYIAFTDDDCILTKSWLTQLHKTISHSDQTVAGVGGPLKSAVSSENPKTIDRYIQFLDEFNFTPVFGRFFISTKHVRHIKDPIVVPYLRTSNAMFKTMFLKAVKGFDPEFRRPGGEDPDLCYRLMNLNGKLIFDPSIAIDHDSRDSFTSYFRSLKNYIEGETRKARKKSQYKNEIIRRSYSMIPLQKGLSLALHIFRFPKSSFEIYKNQTFKKYESLLFPCILIFSKFYSLVLSTLCFFKTYNDQNFKG